MYLKIDIISDKILKKDSGVKIQVIIFLLFLSGVVYGTDFMTGIMKNDIKNVIKYQYDKNNFDLNVMAYDVVPNKVYLKRYLYFDKKKKLQTIEFVFCSDTIFAKNVISQFNELEKELFEQYGKPTVKKTNKSVFTEFKLNENYVLWRQEKVDIFLEIRRSLDFRTYCVLSFKKKPVGKGL